MTITILAIDDSEDDQQLYRRAFKDVDCRLVMASSAKAGFICMADMRPDVILLDYNLPDMDGLGIMKVFAGFSDKPAPVIMLTGEGSEQVAVEVMKSGANDYLVKDTAGQYLRLLPGMIERAVASHVQREQNQKLLRETARLLRRNQLLMQNSVDGIHVMDIGGNIVEANDAFCRMLGYTQEEVAGLNVAGWNAQWTAEELRARLRNFIGKSGVFETLYRRKDGTLIDVEISTSHVEMEGQDLFFALSRDITERKRAEGVLRLNKTIIEMAYDGFWLFDTNGYLLDVNQAYADMVGYTREELAGMHISRLSVQSNTPELVRARIEKAIGHGLSHFETQHRHKDGHVVDFEASIAYIPEAKCLFSFIRDVTARKKAETVLRQHKLVLDTSIDGFWMTDVKGNLLEANEAYAKMSGYTVEELASMHISQLEAIELKPEDVHAHIAKVAAHGYDRFETRHRHKDGHEIDIEVSVTYMAESQRLSVFCRDITERKRMQLKTEALLRRNQALMETSMDGIHVLDIKGNLIEANDAFCRMLGYSREEMVGSSVADWAIEFPGGESRLRFSNNIGQSIMIETLYRRKDGTPINVEIGVVREEMDGQGLLFCSSRNITGRKKAYQEILLKSEAERKNAEILMQQFGSLLQCSFNEIYMFDANSLHFILTSEGAERNLGYSADELNQLTPLDLNSSLTLESCKRLVAPLQTGEQPSLFFETFLQRKNGTTYPVEARLQFMNGDSPVFLAIIQDVTERKQAERWLYESMEKIEDLYNNAPCGYHSLDKDGVILMINDTELAWLGYTRDEVVGKNRLVDLLTPAGRQTFNETFPQFMKQGVANDLELEFIRKDGTELVGLVSATAIYGPGGDFVMSRSTVADITGRKKAEHKLRELTTHLQSVREEEKAGIAREIHDDLGGTLTALKMETHQLKAELPPDKNAKPLLEHVEAISQLVSNAAGITRRIISDLRPTILDDLGILAALEWQTAQFRKHTGIECRVNCIGDKGNLDKARSIALFRILQEALNNVAKHSGASMVEIEFHHNDEEVVMSVIDNGRGMAEIRPDTSIPYGILGMNERADQLGGKISFDTPPGGGFNVTVILPLPINEGEKT